MITIDGSFGEGGGQIIRSSLTLSMITGKPFFVDNIRAGRKKPGLLRQHLTAVSAAAEIAAAKVDGNRIGSGSLAFEPLRVEGGSFHFSIGSAGSCTLVFQTVLPALMITERPSELTLEGGTHNPFAPPFDALQGSFLPIVNRMGPQVTVDLERPGFYPAGGGKFRASIKPSASLVELDLRERGPVLRQTAKALVSRLPRSIAEREIRVVRDALRIKKSAAKSHEVEDPVGPGNVLFINVDCENVTEVFTGFGERGVPAETVAKRAVKEARQYLDSNAAVGQYLADQLLIPMALCGGGKYTTLEPSAHTSTNIEIIKKFLPVDIRVEPIEPGVWCIQVSEAGEK